MKLDRVSRDGCGGITPKAQILSLLLNVHMGEWVGDALRIRSPQFFFKQTKEKLLNDSNASTLVLVLRKQTKEIKQTQRYRKQLLVTRVGEVWEQAK